MATLTSLPPSVLSRVLEFCVYRFTPDLAPSARELPLNRLKDVALVCKTTLHSVRSLVAIFRASTMNLELEDAATSQDVATMLQTVETRGNAVQDLRIQLGDYEGSRYSTTPGPGKLEKVEIQWEKIFTLMPAVKRLDLTKIPLESKHIVEILQVVTKCRNLEFLILPQKGETISGSQIDKVLTTLYGAMERWFYNGGLRQLTVPTRNTANRFQGSTQFIENVIKFCPKIEYLDGYQELVSYADVSCTEMWTISLDTWRTFNATCTQLRSFNWFVVPFADPFFRVFGEHVKPKLTSLELSANTSWNYNRYISDCNPLREANDASGETNIPGYGVSASEASAVFKACPALTSLSIQIDCLNNNRPRRQYVNPAVYGDEFWETVSEHCPLLQSIEMMDSSNFQNFNIQSTIGLSDRTLLTLAKLKFLTSVEFSAARLTGKGIFEWLSRVCKMENSGDDERMLGIRIGGHQRTRLAAPSFYAEIVELLKLLSETSEESLGAASCRAKPLLYVTNPYESKVSRAWSKPYMRDKLNPLLETVKAKHPSLSLNISVFGRQDNQFNRIETLTLDWRPQERERELFFDYMEEEAEHEIYRDASSYEVVSDIEGEMEDEDDVEYEGDMEDYEVGGVAMQNMMFYRAFMERFLYGADESDDDEDM